jgi:hypothetical protein
MAQKSKRYKCALSSRSGSNSVNNESREKKTAIIQVRDCPTQRKYYNPKLWRCLNASTAQSLKSLLTTALPDYRIMVSSVDFAHAIRSQGPVQDLACDIQEYSQADMLIGVHGAGLTNMMFMKPGGIVAEIVGGYVTL